MTTGIDTSLLRLLQLASPMLPVGAYAYSQGLEWAVERGWIADEAGAADWIEGLLHHGLAHLDVPLLARIYRAFDDDRDADAHAWSRSLHAARESAELQAEQRQLGQSLARLLADLDIPAARPWVTLPYAGFVPLFALAAQRWRVALDAALGAYLWAWCENQTAGAIKLVPLGQTAGQRILSRLVAAIPRAVAAGLALDDGEIGALAPRLAIASALHETQYTRLFRS
ncbi:MAG TPA: urease accessory protein UreF [Acidiferrobacterales bacterium]